MKFKYYGTASAIGVPGLFCDCENCKKIKKIKGKNIRTRSQACIDNKILMDFPTDTYLHVVNYDLPLTKIHSCLVTHSHADHLYEKDLLMRDERWTFLEDTTPLTMYVTNVAEGKINAINCPQSRIVTKAIKPYETIDVEGYKVTPLKANHDSGTDPVIFIIEKDGKSVFYGNDTGRLEDEVWEYLARTKPYFNFVNLDCTMGLNEKPDVAGGHMCLEECVELKDEFVKKGYANDNTLFYLTHLTHDCPLYDEFQKEAEKYGMNVAYDNLEIEF